MNAITPRAYQTAALDCVITELKTKASTLVDMFTGAGKSFLLAWLGMLLGGRTLIVVHRDELKRNAVKKINKVCPELGVTVEQGEHRGDRRRERNLFSDEPSSIVVASKDTLSKPNRLGRYRPDDFDYVIIDEAHRAVKKNESYHAIVRHFCRPPLGTGVARLVGLSASLDRLDGEALGGIFQSVAYRYTIHEAIDDGYCLEAKVKRPYVKGVKLLSLPRARNPDGRHTLTQAEIDQFMRTREYVHGVTAPLLELAGDRRQSIVFCSSEQQVRMQYDSLNGAKRGCAVVCLGEPYQSAAERREAQERFEAKDVQHILTVDVLTEGYDYDGVEIVVPGPSRSRAKTAQKVGRGTRPLEGVVDVWGTAELRRLAIASSPKPYCDVLDTCGVSEQHSLLHVEDIFRGRFSSARPRSGAPGARTARPEDLDERRAARNARAAIEAERYEGIQVRVEYEMTETDMMRPPTKKAGAVSRATTARPATPGQCAFLQKRGLPVPAGLTKSAAGALIGEILARESAGPPTPGQARYLLAIGRSPDVTRGEARAIIQEHADRQRGTEGSP